MSEPDRRSIDWGLTTWDGSRREQLRRAARLSLREGLEAVEEMARLAGRLQEMQERRHDAPARVREPGITGASRWPAADPPPPSDTRGE